MKISERLLLIFMTVVFFALVLLIGTCIWYTPVLAAVISVIGSSVYIKIAASAILLILLVLSFRSMLVSTHKAKENALMAASTDEGGIYINLDTVSSLAKTAVKKVDGVKELRVKTVVNDEGANIAVKAALSPEVVIPEVSALIQQSVKVDIETLCGIKVKKVTIQIDNSLQPQNK